MQLSGTESVDVVDDDGVGVTVVVARDWTGLVPLEPQADKTNADTRQNEMKTAR